jgi:hypothetical protein
MDEIIKSKWEFLLRCKLEIGSMIGIGMKLKIFSWLLLRQMILSNKLKKGKGLLREEIA